MLYPLEYLLSNCGHITLCFCVTGADAIIRQHKAACLRITALLVCNGLLWLGTSAGVVLTVSLPKITPHTSALAMPVIPQGLTYGHTGHVRFLACAEITDKDHSSLSRGSKFLTVDSFEIYILFVSCDAIQQVHVVLLRTSEDHQVPMQ